jgi:hypothetical protein
MTPALVVDVLLALPLRLRDSPQSIWGLLPIRQFEANAYSLKEFELVRV